MSDVLDKALRDAKKGFQPKEPDWEAIDAKLFAGIDAEDASEGSARVARIRSVPRAWGWACGALAVAAAAALFVGKRPASPSFEASRCASSPCAPAKASALLTHTGDGEVFVGGAAAVAGAELRAGDVLETSGAVAFLQRDDAVTWDLEEQSKVVVTKASTSLVLSLERGAVEAQVTPVPSGEAFAVDVAAPDGRVTRIAVHGTHLRVARSSRTEGPGRLVDTKIVVDLNEGVVSIGAPPRTGSTYGTLVTAPAHIELDARDPAGTLVVTHEPAAVRAARALTITAASPAVASMPRPVQSSAPIAALPAPMTAPVVRAAPHPPTEPAIDPNAPDTITKAVKACMGSHAPPSDGNLKVSVSTTLELHLADRGVPDFARFDPPLPQDVQECATAVIYKTRFASGGTTRIRLDF